jgi:hypothetical protein
MITAIHDESGVIRAVSIAGRSYTPEELAQLVEAQAECDALRAGRRALMATIAELRLDALAYRWALAAVAHFWRNDPLAFGDEASPTTLAGRFASIAQICIDTLETTERKETTNERSLERL